MVAYRITVYVVKGAKVETAEAWTVNASDLGEAKLLAAPRYEHLVAWFEQNSTTTKVSHYTVSQGDKFLYSSGEQRGGLRKIISKLFD